MSSERLEAEGIVNSDLIAVDPAGRWNRAWIMLVLVDEKITVKRPVKRDGAWFLDPRARSDVYKTLSMSKPAEIWGVVASDVRRLPVE